MNKDTYKSDNEILKAEKYFKDYFESRRITHLSEIAPIEPTILIRDAIIGTKGGITLVAGVQKSGKSTIVRSMIQGSLGFQTEALKMQITPATSKPVVYFNTEMSDTDTKKYHDEILKEIKLQTTPPNLHILQLQMLSKADRTIFIKDFFAAYPDTHLAIIDGVADLVDSVNDEKNCNALIDELNKTANRHKMTLVLIVHENVKSETTRGHLGQEAERKSVATISVKKDRNTGEHCIEPKVTRHTQDFANVWFKRTQEGLTGIERTVTTGKQKLSNEYQESRSLLESAFDKDKFLESKQLKNRLIESDPDDVDRDTKRKRAERAIRKAEEYGLLQYGDVRGKPSVYLAEVPEHAKETNHRKI